MMLNEFKAQLNQAPQTEVAPTPISKPTLHLDTLIKGNMVQCYLTRKKIPNHKST